MNDNASIKIPPKTAITVDIGNTLPDILPLLQRGVTTDKIPENDTDTLPKISLSIRIGILGEKEKANGR